jgi:hypothetical protein
VADVAREKPAPNEGVTHVNKILSATGRLLGNLNDRKLGTGRTWKRIDRLASRLYLMGDRTRTK